MASRSILIIDDDPMVRAFARKCLENQTYEVLEATTAEDGLDLAQNPSVALVLLDIKIQKMDGEEILDRLNKQKPGLPIVVLTVSKDIDLAVRCLKKGARDFLNKPCAAHRLITTINNVIHTRELEQRVQAIDEDGSQRGYDVMQGRSEAIRRVFEQMKLLATNDINVLIEGPTGSGKELVARALHRKGKRHGGPFVALNCGAIPDTLLESELFGHEKGAFTGAVTTRGGCFEQAHGGTLFLDEIAEMRLDMQIRLLRVLETREVQRLGSGQTTKVDVRVLSATNKNLRRRVKEGLFREDLYYRLAVYPLKIPSLRKRGNDILILAERFMLTFASEMKKNLKGLDPKVTELLMTHAWPGNVRELRNVLERACLIAKGPLIGEEDLPDEIRGIGSGLYAWRGADESSARMERTRASASNANVRIQEDDNEGIRTLDDEEKRIIERALLKKKGDISDTARALGIGRSTLYRRIQKYKLIANLKPNA